MELQLIGQNDEEARRYVLPNGETLIGRKPVCGIVLNAPSVATRHARVFSIDEQAVIHGISPEWPVYVNGDPVTRRVLEDGDNVELAHYRLRFVQQPRPRQTTALPSQPVDPQPVEPNTEDSTGVPEISEEPPVHAAPEPLPEIPVANAPGSPFNARLKALSEEISTELSQESKELEALPTEPGEDAEEPAVHAAPEPLPEIPVAGEDAVEDDSTVPPSSPFHLDIISGINQGRRVTLTHNHVILGFDRQRLVEIKTTGEDLVVRTLSDDVEARLNDEPINHSFVKALPGDVLWLRRISMRIHQD